MNRHSPDPFYQQDTGFREQVVQVFKNIMSSKRRQRPESDHQSEKPATQENRLFRAAWRSSWSGNTHIVVQRRPFSTIAGIFLVLYMTAFVFFRFHNTGGLQALFYWSNSALILGAAGLLLHSGLLIGISIAFASASHMTFMYDLLIWMLFDRFPVGRAMYLEQDLDFSLLATTLHQFWYLPLLCCIIYCEYSGQLRLMKRYWAFSVIINFMVAILAKTHFEYQATVFGTKIAIVPDFVLGHELWSEELTLLHRYDDLPAVVYATWSTLLESVFMNGVCYIFLQVFFYLLLEGQGVIEKEKTT